MVKRLAVGLLITIAFGTSGPWAQTPTPAGWTACDDQQAENAALRALVVDLQGQLAQATSKALATERLQLVEEFRKKQGAPADAVFDWTTHRFTASEKPKEATK